MKKTLFLLIAVALLSGLTMAQVDGDNKGTVGSFLYKFAYMAFDNMNGGAVYNNPTVATTFTLAVDSLITSIQTYHWNNGQGANFGTIKLIGATGVVYGPWAAAGIAGVGKTFWQVAPNVVLPYGTYTIVDSNNATWSHNAQSGSKGFAKVSAKK